MQKQVQIQAISAKKIQKKEVKKRIIGKKSITQKRNLTIIKQIQDGKIFLEEIHQSFITVRKTGRMKRNMNMIIIPIKEELNLVKRKRVKERFMNIKAWR